MMKKIKLFGERNTGTNYLRELISQNLEVTLLEGGIPEKYGWMKSPFLFDLLYDKVYAHHLGWKHSLPDVQRLMNYPGIQETLVITVTKNPYAYLLSLYKRPYHHKGAIPGTFGGFLQSSWKALRREHCPSGAYATPVHLWNLKSRSYLDLKTQLPANTLNLTYENLISDPAGILTQISREWGIPLKPGGFTPIEQSTKEQDKDFDYYRRYYLEEEWKKLLKPEDIAFINTHLDKELVALFGYELLP